MHFRKTCICKRIGLTAIFHTPRLAGCRLEVRSFGGKFSGPDALHGANRQVYVISPKLSFPMPVLHFSSVCKTSLLGTFSREALGIFSGGWQPYTLYPVQIWKLQHPVDLLGLNVHISCRRFCEHILSTKIYWNYLHTLCLICSILTPFNCAYLQHNCTQLVILYVSWLCMFSQLVCLVYLYIRGRFISYNSSHVGMVSGLRPWFTIARSINGRRRRIVKTELCHARRRWSAIGC